MSHWLASCVFVLPIALLAFAGCKPAPGRSCSADSDSVLCLDPQTRLSCEGEKWQSESCLGPAGCEVSGRFVKCDTSIANEGAACEKDGNYSCTADKKTMLICQGRKWAFNEKCLGERGCVAGFMAVCDSSIGVEGEICGSGTEATKGVSYGCTADKKTLLACKDRKWKRTEECVGPKGCEGMGGIAGGRVTCDGPSATPGGFCVNEGKDDFACSPDKKSLVKCDTDGWKVVRSCLGPEACSASGHRVSCDDSVQPPDAACEKEGAAACSTDGKAILECKGGKFTKSRACPGACKIAGSLISCE